MSTMDKVYTDGFFAQAAKTDKQKEFIVSRCAIQVDDFVKFLDKNKGLVNEKGYLNFDLKRSMKDPDKFYGEVNQYKPKTTEKVTAKDHSPDRDNDLPF